MLCIVQCLWCLLAMLGFAESPVLPGDLCYLLNKRRDVPELCSKHCRFSCRYYCNLPHRKKPSYSTAPIQRLDKYFNDGFVTSLASSEGITFEKLRERSGAGTRTRAERTLPLLPRGMITSISANPGFELN